MKFLVTGGVGFLGINPIRFLTDCGYRQSSIECRVVVPARSSRHGHLIACRVMLLLRSLGENLGFVRSSVSELDLRAIAKEGDLDLEKPEDREEALDRLEAVHVRLGDVLTDARVLRAVDDADHADGQTRNPGLVGKTSASHEQSHLTFSFQGLLTENRDYQISDFFNTIRTNRTMIGLRT